MPNASRGLNSRPQAVALARHARAASAATLSVRYYAGADPVLTLDGTVLSDGAEVALTDTATLDVPGLAALTVQPARTGDSDALPTGRKRAGGGPARGRV